MANLRQPLNTQGNRRLHKFIANGYTMAIRHRSPCGPRFSSAVEVMVYVDATVLFFR